MIRYVKLITNRIGLFYAKMLCKRQYYAQQFVGINERPIELQFLFKQLTRNWAKTVLDVGTGDTALPQLIRHCGFIVTAIDNIQEFWRDGMINRHYHVINDDITNTRLNRTFDFISCISVLEHIKDHKSAMKSMFSLLNPGGHLVLTFPYNEKTYIENVYMIEGSGARGEKRFVTQVYSRKQLDDWLLDNNGKLLEQEYWRFFEGEYWTFGERLCPPVQVDKDTLHHITCVLLQKRI